jgi:hypothetical protein
MKELANVPAYFAKADQMHFVARILNWANGQHEAGKPY